MDLLGTPGAAVVAVQSGRVVHLGHSHALGRYLVLRDVYGDIFTYAGLGSIAPRYRRPTPPSDPAQHTPGSAVAAPEGPPKGARTGADAAGHRRSSHPADAQGQGASTGARRRRPRARPNPKRNGARGHGQGASVRAPRQSACPRREGAAKSSAAENSRWLPLRRGSLV